MHRLMRKLSIAMALVAALGMVGSNSAYGAAAAAGAMVGGGTISPGLTTTPTFQTSVTFTGSAVGAGAVVAGGGAGTGADAGVYAVSFSGSSDIPVTAQQGQGSGTGTISGVGLVNPVADTITCYLHYVRVGPVVVILGTSGISANGATQGGGTAIGAFLFVPGQFPPAAVTSYTLVGVAAAVADTRLEELGVSASAERVTVKPRSTDEVGV